MLRPLLVLCLASGSVVASDAPPLRADACGLEQLINERYAYLERLPNGRFELSAKLRAECSSVGSKRELVRYAERALGLLADHHAITGTSLPDSWATFPTYGDLWIVRTKDAFLIEAVRKGSPAEQAGMRAGDQLTAVDGTQTNIAVDQYWAELGTQAGGDRDGYAARVLAAGRRDRPRRLTVSRAGATRTVELQNLYQPWREERPLVSAITLGADLHISLGDSLGDNAAIEEFDRAMADAKPRQRIVVDLTDTPSGGNTTVARAILGWFVSKPSGYQVHALPAEERRTGVARQWVEQVLPRQGKRHSGPVTVCVGRWTGSMGEGLAIGFDAIGATVEGTRMAGLLGAIYDYPLGNSGVVVKLPTEKLSGVSGTARERFLPRRSCTTT